MAAPAIVLTHTQSPATGTAETTTQQHTESTESTEHATVGPQCTTNGRPMRVWTTQAQLHVHAPRTNATREHSLSKLYSARTTQHSITQQRRTWQHVLSPDHTPALLAPPIRPAQTHICMGPTTRSQDHCRIHPHQRSPTAGHSGCGLLGAGVVVSTLSQQ
jgi:hypothetical protein